MQISRGTEGDLFMMLHGISLLEQAGCTKGTGTGCEPEFTNVERH